eukprot:TRINITY_DN1301_c2_g1_i1.p1 TRINITY_DN1301_c2_g1~~TRINITY_DN1301_c2_g1_i1.p1  ORF type:complete len:225 (+),score=41.86 TRINITY_DN1301_c2_g1_i1:68-676(+)
MERSCDVILRVEDVVVMEKSYKLYEGGLAVLVVDAVTEEERSLAGSQLVFGVCGDIRVPLSKEVVIENRGCGRYYTDMLGKELLFILPNTLPAEQVAYVEEILGMYADLRTHDNTVSDRGAPHPIAAPAAPEQPPAREARSSVTSISILDKAREAKARFFKDDAPQQAKKAPTNPQKTTISDSVAKSMFQLTSMVRGDKEKQ